MSIAGSPRSIPSDVGSRRVWRNSLTMIGFRARSMRLLPFLVEEIEKHVLERRRDAVDPERGDLFRPERPENVPAALLLGGNHDVKRRPEDRRLVGPPLRAHRLERLDDVMLRQR